VRRHCSRRAAIVPRRRHPRLPRLGPPPERSEDPVDRGGREAGGAGPGAGSGRQGRQGRRGDGRLRVAEEGVEGALTQCRRAGLRPPSSLRGQHALEHVTHRLVERRHVAERRLDHGEEAVLVILERALGLPRVEVLERLLHHQVVVLLIRARLRGRAPAPKRAIHSSERAS